MRLRLYGLVLAALVMVGGCESGFTQAQSGKPDIHRGVIEETVYHGGIVTPPLPKPSFTLTDTSGAPFDFSARTDGYVTLLFFGYTHCTSICPMQMATLSAAMKQLPQEVTDRFKVVFVTTDPAHDNPRQLRTWLNNFNKSFIGLSGSATAIKSAQVAAKVPYGGDASEHAAFILAYTKDNLGHVIYPAGITQSDWMHDLPRLASENWK